MVVLAVAALSVLIIVVSLRVSLSGQGQGVARVLLWVVASMQVCVVALTAIDHRPPSAANYFVAEVIQLPEPSGGNGYRVLNFDEELRNRPDRQGTATAWRSDPTRGQPSLHC